MAAQAPRYRFRVLDVSTIVSQFTEMAINVSTADLENPQPQIVRYVYGSLVDIIMGVTDREGPRFAALEHIEHPELHEESLAEARFNSNLRKIMYVAGVHDFAYTRDLHTPQKQRLKVHLSALINLVLYRLTKLNTFSEKAAEAEQINDLKQRTELETQQAQAKLRQLRQQQEREEPILKQLQEEIEAQEANIRQYNSRQATLQNELRDLKSLALEKMDKITQLKVSIGNCKQDNVKLQSSVLQSPEKVKKHMEDMEHSLVGVQGSIAESSKRSEELKARYVHCCKIEKDIRKCIGLLGDIEAESNKYKKGTKQSKENKAKKLEMQKALQELLTQEQSVQRTINSHSDKAARASQTNASRKEQAEQMLRDVKEEKQKIEKEQNALKPILDQQAMEVIQVQQQMSARSQEYEKLEREEVAQYRKLVDSVQKYLFCLCDILKIFPLSLHFYLINLHISPKHLWSDADRALSCRSLLFIICTITIKI